MFLILGTAHGPTKMPFALTRKHFETPWGVVETDQAFLTDFEKECPLNFYEDEFVHKTEHSIELQLVFLRALRPTERPFRIVPVLCGSFHEAIARDLSPLDLPGVREFLEAVRKVKSGSQGKFASSPARIWPMWAPGSGTRSLRIPRALKILTDEDRADAGAIRNLDREGFFAFLRREKDRRKICGSSAIYTLLSLIELPERGTLEVRSVRGAELPVGGDVREYGLLSARRGRGRREIEPL